MTLHSSHYIYLVYIFVYKLSIRIICSFVVTYLFACSLYCFAVPDFALKYFMVHWKRSLIGISPPKLGTFSLFLELPCTYCVFSSTIKRLYKLTMTIQIKTSKITMSVGSCIKIDTKSIQVTETENITEIQKLRLHTLSCTKNRKRSYQANACGHKACTLK